MSSTGSSEYNRESELEMQELHLELEGLRATRQTLQTFLQQIRDFKNNLQITAVNLKELHKVNSQCEQFVDKSSPESLEEESSNTQISHEKMDTGTDSMASLEITPNSQHSSDFGDRENNHVDSLRPANGNRNLTNGTKEKIDGLNFVNYLHSPSNILYAHDFVSNMPMNKPIGVSPPQISSGLTTTADHPLMSLSSPDSPLHNNFTDFGHDGPQRNTSKNNLYFSENFSAVDGNIFNETSIKYGIDNFGTSSPNVNQRETQLSVSAGTRNGVFHANRRKIVPCFRDSLDVEKKVEAVVPQRVLGRDIVRSTPSKDAITKYILERNKKTLSDAESVFESPNSKLDKDNSPKIDLNLSLVLDDNLTFQEFDSGPVEFPDSPSVMRRKMNFVLPVELSSNISINDQMSPDLSTCSTEKDISQYCAVVDPACGHASLHQTSATSLTHHNNSSSKRRRIKARMESTRVSLSPTKFANPVPSRSESPDDGVSLDSEQVWSRGQHDCKGSDTDTEECSKRDSERSVSESLTCEQIPEFSAQEERREQRHWMKVQLTGGEYHSIDMKVIEPYKRVMSHGGYTAENEAIIIFSACFLPDNSRVDHNYVMDNLFLYVLSTLENLVTDDYIVVYLHGSAEGRRLPSFHWLGKCYKLIDRRFRKSLKHIYLVHPTFWLKSIVFMAKSFTSSKVSRKLSYVNSLHELCTKVPIQSAAIPEAVRRYDLNKSKNNAQ